MVDEKVDHNNQSSPYGAGYASVLIRHGVSAMHVRRVTESVAEVL